MNANHPILLAIITSAMASLVTTTMITNGGSTVTSATTLTSMDPISSSINTTDAMVEDGNKSSLDSESTSDAELYSIILPILMSFCLISAIVSTLVVAAVPWLTKPISPTIKLSISLSISNTVFALTMFIDIIINSYLHKVWEVDVSSCIKLTILAIRMSIIIIQVLHLLVMAINHYIGTLRPLHYASTFTPNILKFVILLLWAVPVMCMVIGFASIPAQGYQSPGCKVHDFYSKEINFRIIWTTLFSVFSVVLVLIYSHIFSLLKRRGEDLSEDQRILLNRNTKLIKTTSLMVGTFIIGWGPAVVAFILVCPECPINPANMTLRTRNLMLVTVNFMFFIKVFADTFIYAYRLQGIRQAIRAMTCLVKIRLCGAPNSCSSSSSNLQSRTMLSKLSSMNT